MNRKLKTKELKRLEKDEFKKLKKFPIIVILDNIRSLHNVGSIFRSCDALKVEKVLLCGLTACPPHKEIHKTALGATESVEWSYFEDVTEAVRYCKRLEYQIVPAEQAEDTVLLQDLNTKSQEKLAFVFGNEVFGVNQEVISMSDFVLEIPQFGTKHSFNVSVSAGIVLWEAVKMRI